MIYRSRRMLAGASLALASALALSACTGSDTPTDATPPPKTFQLDDVTKDDAAAGLLPADLAAKGTLVVGTDPTYPPLEFIDSDGTTIAGMDIDIIQAVGKKLGVDMQPQATTFDQVLPNMGTLYDAGVAGLTITPDRIQFVDFVSYYQTATLWAVAASADPIDPNAACGKRVAVQTATLQEVDVNDKSNACLAAGQPGIVIQSYQDQAQATTAVVSGAADAVLADADVINYAIERSGDALVVSGAPYAEGSYGIALPKAKEQYADAVLGALKSLIDDGTYALILEKWGAEEGAIVQPEINPSGG